MLESNPLLPGHEFPDALPDLVPREFEYYGNAEAGGGLRLSDPTTSVLIECADPAPCRELAAVRLGDRAFTLDLLHAASAGGPLRLQAVRFDP